MANFHEIELRYGMMSLTSNKCACITPMRITPMRKLLFSSHVHWDYEKCSLCSDQKYHFPNSRRIGQIKHARNLRRILIILY